MKPRAVVIEVHLELPEHATSADALGYVTDAVCGWRGGLIPNEDAMQPLERGSVRARVLHKGEALDEAEWREELRYAVADDDRGTPVAQLLPDLLRQCASAVTAVARRALSKRYWERNALASRAGTKDAERQHLDELLDYVAERGWMFTAQVIRGNMPALEARREKRLRGAVHAYCAALIDHIGLDRVREYVGRA